MNRLTLIVLALAFVTAQPVAQTQTNPPQRGTASSARTTAGVLGPGPPANVEALSIETMEIQFNAGASVNVRVRDTTSA